MSFVPYEPFRAEVEFSHSRFIASIAPADSIEEARAYLAAIRREFPDATHHVPAFLIGSGASVTEYCSDDGEPSGTSGRPLLTVLRGSGLGDAALVVTRYFGGTLLGTGGLVKAYSAAGKLAVEGVRRAILEEAGLLHLDLPYPLFDRVKQSLDAFGAEIREERFDEAVHLRFEASVARLAELESRLRELSAGALVPRLLERRIARRPVEPSQHE